MKKFFYLAMALSLVACQVRKIDVEGGVEEAGINYLSVNIVSANGGTRAAGEFDDPDNSYTGGNPAHESTVKTLLFYFFDKDGEPAVVDFANGASYKLYQVNEDNFPEAPSVSDDDKKTTVEKIHKETIIIQTKKVNDSYVGVPAKTLVVINPDYTEEENQTLTQVLAKVNVTKTGFGGLTNTNGFTMSNSVYVDEGELVQAVNISDKVQPTKDDAIANPVDIYVERVVSKLTMKIGDESDKLKLVSITGKENVYDTGKTYDDNGEQPIYVQIIGWNVTATTDRSRYVKAANAAWNNTATAANLFKTPSQPWSYADFHRSFWAVNPRGVDFLYGNFNHGNQAGTASVDIPDDNWATHYKDLTGKMYVYIPENAGEGRGDGSPWTAAAATNPTKVILAAQLLDKNGNPLELAQYLGQTFVAGTNYAEIKKAILAVVTNSHKLYRENSETHEFVSIDENDIDIKTAWEVGLAGEETEGRYLSYAVLTATAKGYTWYKGDPSGIAPEDLDTWKQDNAISGADNNKIVAGYLLAAGGAKVWNSGNTYYYFNVRHVADPMIDGKLSTDPEYDLEAAEKVPGYYGVVRNHIYNTVVTGITGLGTPVFNPNEIIIPEKPADEFGYIAARINVLEWRIVNSNYDLNW